VPLPASLPFFGVVMNCHFVMHGTASTNALLGVFIILAWKSADWWVLDRRLLPLLGTPWRPGRLFAETPDSISTDNRARYSRLPGPPSFISSGRRECPSFATVPLRLMNSLVSPHSGHCQRIVASLVLRICH